MVWFFSNPNSLIEPSLLKRKDGRVAVTRIIERIKNIELKNNLLFGTKNIIMYYINLNIFL
jgi:hypothetical protein